ncbi:MAG: hypothetical protein AAF657_04580 [Acidobacteriota bacterium]
MDFQDYDLEPRTPWRRWITRLGVVVALAAMIALAFWPRQTAGVRGDGREAKACSAKLGSLAMAIATGHTMERTLSEREINAHLGRLIDHNRDRQSAGGLTLALTDLEIDLGEEVSALYVSGRLIAVPVVFEARFVDAGDRSRASRKPESPLRLDTLHLGRLPLIGPFKALVASQMMALLARLPTESTVLTRLDALAMEEDRVTLAVDGSAEGEMILPAE